MVGCGSSPACGPRGPCCFLLESGPVRPGEWEPGALTFPWRHAAALPVPFSQGDAGVGVPRVSPQL